jgi:hypothetical protein
VGTIPKYHTVGTNPKYHTIGSIPKYQTFGTIPKYHIVGTITKHALSEKFQNAISKSVHLANKYMTAQCPGLAQIFLS